MNNGTDKAATKKTISKIEYYTVLGMMELARQHSKMSESFWDGMIAYLQTDNDDWISDAIWGDPDMDVLLMLERMGFEVDMTEAK